VGALAEQFRIERPKWKVSLSPLAPLRAYFGRRRKEYHPVGWRLVVANYVLLAIYLMTLVCGS
jgi:hypothetical protein